MKNIISTANKNIAEFGIRGPVGFIAPGDLSPKTKQQIFIKQWSVFHWSEDFWPVNIISDPYATTFWPRSTKESIDVSKKPEGRRWKQLQALGNKPKWPYHFANLSLHLTDRSSRRGCLLEKVRAKNLTSIHSNSLESAWLTHHSVCQTPTRSG